MKNMQKRFLGKILREPALRAFVLASSAGLILSACGSSSDSNPSKSNPVQSRPETKRDTPQTPDGNTPNTPADPKTDNQNNQNSSEDKKSAEGKLGASLAVLMNAGKPAFGASYTYGNDPDGSNYLLTFTPKIAFQSVSYRWNFYTLSSDSFLLEWDSSRITGLGTIQVKVSGADIVNKILVGQKRFNGMSDLHFVLADDNNKPIYNLAISDMCANFPNTFKNLTDSSACDQISP